MKTTIASAQYPISQHKNLEDWKNHTEKWVVNAVEHGAELLLFPEYGSMELVSTLADDIQQNLHVQIEEMQALLPFFLETFSSLSTKYKVIIVAPSFPVKVETKFYNRAYVFAPGNKMGYQDKFFMTRFENEEWGISTPPKKMQVFETTFGSFGIQICYDSEFALGTHHLAAAGMNLLLVPSCTETIRGATRVHIGSRARAMEQQLYAVVSQTVGNALWSPAVDINYGYSGFYTTPDKNLPEEGIIEIDVAQAEKWHVVTLDFSLLPQVREDGQVLNFQDSQRLSINYATEDITVERIRLY